MSSSLHSNDTISYKSHEAVLRCDLQHIDSRLGSLVQLFDRCDEEYGYLGEGKCWESIFRLYAQDSSVAFNARHLVKAHREGIWDEVFRLKNKFLQEQEPALVVHRIKHPFPFERRLALYRERLDLTNYNLWNTSTLILLERKHKGTN